MPEIRLLHRPTHPQSTYLMQYEKQVYSQHGEDGIIEKIFEIIGTKNKWCAEFGAYDGIHLSNTYNLLQNHGWSSVLIEADSGRFDQLEENMKPYPKAHCLKRYVNIEGEGRLDHILAETDIPRDFDLLSIDIDSTDYHIWKSLVDYRPRLVIVEYNSTLPNEVIFIQDPDPSVYQGSSLSALVELGKQKGYELVCVNITNAFFVQKQDYPKFNIPNNSVDAMRSGAGMISHLLQAYDGKMYVGGNRRLIWGNIPFDERYIKIHELKNGYGAEPDIAKESQKKTIKNISMFKPVALSSRIDRNRCDESLSLVNDIRTGAFSVCTKFEKEPWCVIDLEAMATLDHMHVYNCMGQDAVRTKHLSISVSENNKEWTQVYSHDGSIFGGTMGTKPLVVDFPEGTKARYVKLSLPDEDHLMLDEVDVFGFFENE